MENRSVHDVRPEQYATVIRDLIKHENELTNHRTMWLLIVQALLVNAYIMVRRESQTGEGVAWAGILVTLSAFLMLYKSYQARGYLRFLGAEAKRGRLAEEHLGLDGWPRRRIRHWWKDAWSCPWLERAGDVLEPYLFLPALIVAWWLSVLLRRWIPPPPWKVMGTAIVTAAFVLSVFCIVWVRYQGRDEEGCNPPPPNPSERQ